MAVVHKHFGTLSQAVRFLCHEVNTGICDELLTVNSVIGVLDSMLDEHLVSTIWCWGNSWGEVLWGEAHLTWQLFLPHRIVDSHFFLFGWVVITCYCTWCSRTRWCGFTIFIFCLALFLFFRRWFQPRYQRHLQNSQWMFFQWKWNAYSWGKKYRSAPREATFAVQQTTTVTYILGCQMLSLLRFFICSLQ